MNRNEKWNRQRRAARRDFWRSFPMGLFDLSDWSIKLPFVIFYFVGAIRVWSKREAAAALLDNAPLTSPVMEVILQNAFTSYMVAGAAALVVLLLYPIGPEGIKQRRTHLQLFCKFFEHFLSMTGSPTVLYYEDYCFI